MGSADIAYEKFFHTSLVVVYTATSSSNLDLVTLPSWSLALAVLSPTSFLPILYLTVTPACACWHFDLQLVTMALNYRLNKVGTSHLFVISIYNSTVTDSRSPQHSFQHWFYNCVFFLGSCSCIFHFTTWWSVKHYVLLYTLISSHHHRVNHVTP